MRDIKFRAWIDGEYMVFSDMSQTHPYDDDEIVWSIQDGLEISTLDMKNAIIGGEIEQYEAFKVRGGKGDEVFFMQFTGLQDKQGVDIYKGDIVSDKDGLHYTVDIGGYFSKESVGNGANYYQIGDDNYWAIEANPFDKETNFTIIGNIHQNPELIK